MTAPHAKPFAQPLVLSAALLLALAGCAHQPIVATAPAAAPAPVPPRPVLAADYQSVTPPPRLADGRFATINADLDPQATIWHLRGAMNVAALGCRAPEDAGLVPAYNTMLTARKAVLARANAAVQASFRAGGAKDWQDQADRYNTRLYNFFAMPAAKPGFCAAADAVAGEAGAIAAADFPAFAAAALPRLEAPFTAVYAAVDSYRTEVAAWDARYAPAAPGGAVATPAVALVPPAASVQTAALR